MKRVIAAMTAAVLMVALVSSAAVAAPAVKTAPTVNVAVLEPSFDTGVYSAYYGPLNGYFPASPGFTATYMGRQSGLIKAGLTIDPVDLVYEDEGLFAFKPAVTINKLASSPLTYDVVNQFGVNPVWMTIEIDTGPLFGDTTTGRSDNVTFQMVPGAYAPSNSYATVNAGTSPNWLQWADSNGTPTGSARTLASIVTEYTGLTVVRTYLRLGMGDSYGPGPNGTQAWVDKASIGGVTYDFVLNSTAPGQNKLQCFDGTTDTGFGGICTLPTKGAKGSAILDNTDTNTAGDYAGVYVENTTLIGLPLSKVTQLSYNYAGTIVPLPGDLSLNIPINSTGGTTTDGYAFIDAYYCPGIAGLVDVIGQANCGIWYLGTEYANWAALGAAFPTAKIANDGALPFVIAERTPAEGPAMWTVSNVKLGKAGK